MVLLVLSQLDYASTITAGLWNQLLDRFQFVPNAAAQTVFSICRHEHITPLLYSLQWLRVAESINFRLALLL